MLHRESAPFLCLRITCLAWGGLRADPGTLGTPFFNPSRMEEIFSMCKEFLAPVPAVPTNRIPVLHSPLTAPSRTYLPAGIRIARVERLWPARDFCL